eukprot:GHVN01059880.1.p1 GENE.GHVN01059880.1~~GHVN01059880.1.p1  ORF type:complete len:339 (-),score=13.80 GHVN01059880.1:202-1218(-)
MKPSNILLNSECHVKVADFGLARSVAQGKDDVSANPVLTDYVATRWYRAPEILLGSTKYTKGVDMWSLGCILGELITGRPIFPGGTLCGPSIIKMTTWFIGTSTMNQLERIMVVTGKPSSEDTEAMKSPFAATMLESLQQKKQKSFQEFFHNATSPAVDLISQLLQFNPNNRISAVKALEHPYVSQFHNEGEEPTCDRIITIAIDDNTKFTIDEYRNKVYSEVIRRKRDQKRERHEASRQDSVPADGNGRSGSNHRYYHSSKSSAGGNDHSYSQHRDERQRHASHSRSHHYQDQFRAGGRAPSRSNAQDGCRDQPPYSESPSIYQRTASQQASGQRHT